MAVSGQNCYGHDNRPELQSGPFSKVVLLMMMIMMMTMMMNMMMMMMMIKKKLQQTLASLRT